MIWPLELIWPKRPARRAEAAARKFGSDNVARHWPAPELSTFVLQPKVGVREALLHLERASELASCSLLQTSKLDKCN